jgi:hypothetical protein
MRLWSAFLAVFASAGCSGDESGLVPVSGVVTLDGTPLTLGSIRFVPERGRPATSKIAGDGSFELESRRVDDVVLEEGIPPGKYRVAVNASQIIDAEAEKVRWLAPPRYADFRTSGLVVHVKADSNDMRIELESSASDSTDDTDDGIAEPPSTASKSAVEQQEAPEK